MGNEREVARTALEPPEESSPVLGRQHHGNTAVGGKPGRVFTPEDHANARAARAAARAAPKPILYAGWWPEDLAEWQRICHAYGYQLPAATAPYSPRRAKVWLKRLGVSLQEYHAWEASTTLTDFSDLNPTWGLLPWLGDVLTQLEKYGNIAPPSAGGRQPYWPDALLHQHGPDCQCECCFSGRKRAEAEKQASTPPAPIPKKTRAK